MSKEFLYVNADGDYENSPGAYELTDFISASAGAGDAGKPIKLDAGGHVDDSMINDGDISHDSTAGMSTSTGHTLFPLLDGTRPFTGDQSMGSNKITSLSDGSDPNDAINFSQLQNAISGQFWKDPVNAYNLIGNETYANLEAGAPSHGDQYVCSSAGTLTDGGLAVVAGDLIEYQSGTGWVKLESGAGGFVADGVRAILSEGTIQAPYTDTTDNDKIIQFDGTSLTGVDTGDAVDKAAVLVQDSGHVSIYDNQGYVYEGTVPSGMWILWTGAGTINAGDGMSKTGNTLNVGGGAGLTANTDDLSVNVDDSSIEISADSLQVKALGITNGMLAGSIDDSKLNTITAANKVSGSAVQLLASGGLKDSTGLAIEPNDFAGEGLVDDGADNLAIDWSTAFNDSKAVKASDLNSVVNGKGASIIGIEDVGGYTSATDVEAALQEIYQQLDAAGLEVYEIDTGETIVKGDMVYFKSADKLGKYPISSGFYAIGIAIAGGTAGQFIGIGHSGNDITGILTGATAGKKQFWNGTGWQETVPATSGAYVWVGCVAKNSTDGRTHIELVKKNA